MTRQQHIEIVAARKRIVSERILRNLSRSRAHAHLGALGRMELADSMAEEAMAATPEPPEEIKPPEPEEDIWPILSNAKLRD